MYGLVCQKENLKVRTEFDGKPVKLFEDGGNVVGGGGCNDGTGS